MIDFNRVNKDTTISKGTVRGTPAYFPERDDWRDGSAKWDIWALAAMILEFDLRPNVYYKVNSEREAINLSQKHRFENGVSGALIEIL